MFDLIKFVEAVNKWGYGPCFYFGNIGMDCGGCNAEDMPLSIVIRPSGYLGGCQITGRGTLENLQDNIQLIIDGKKPKLRLETNPPNPSAKGWYVYGTDPEDIKKDNKWEIV